MRYQYWRITTAALLLAGRGPSGRAASVRIVYEGHIITTSAPVVQLPHGTLVPLRPVVQVLGGHLGWDEKTRTAVVRYRGRRLEVDERAHTLRLNGKRLPELLAPRRARGQLLVPLAGLERFYGTRAQWLPRRRLLSFAAVPKPRPVIGSAASGVTSPPPAPATRRGGSTAGPLLLLTSDRQRYTVGTPVILRLSVKNPGRAPLTLQFSSAQQYDFEVRRNGQAIWRWSAGRMFTQALTSLTLRPGEQRVFAVTWSQQDNNGRPVAAGTYEAIATLTTMSRPQPQSPPITLQIGHFGPG